MEDLGRRPSDHQPPPPHTICVTGEAGERFPPWSNAETKELLMIRAKLDGAFLETKHNRLLWVSVADEMKGKGFNRNDEQCKCKWKNLVTRYKGCETMEPEAMRQHFPFYSEIRAIFSSRMHRKWWIEAEAEPIGSKRKSTELASDDDQKNHRENEEEEEEKGRILSSEKTKKTTKKAKRRRENQNTNGDLQEILKRSVERQMEMEDRWREVLKTRAEERQLKEMQWRKNMEALEREKMVMERLWREREEERREREEARAEKRDALITALLNKILR